MSVVYEAPKGVFTRLMPNSHAFELYQEWKKSGKDKQKKMLDAHMVGLHTSWLKLEGRNP